MTSKLSIADKLTLHKSAKFHQGRLTPHRDNMRMWRPRVFDGVEFLEGSYAGRSFRMHMHDTYVLGVTLDGAGQVFYRGATFYAPKGSIIIIPPYEVHTGDPVPGTVWHYKSIYPSVSLFQYVIKQIDDRIEGVPGFISPVIIDITLANEIIALHDVLQYETDLMSVESEMITTLTKLIRRHGNDSQYDMKTACDHHVILMAREFIMDNTAKRVSLKELSSVAGLSQFQLINEFKKQFGLPPHRYQLNMRIMKARRMLAEGKSIAATTYDLGFSDQSHFNRHFRKILGVTPGQYYRHAIN